MDAFGVESSTTRRRQLLQDADLIQGHHRQIRRSKQQELNHLAPALQVRRILFAQTPAQSFAHAFLFRNAAKASPAAVSPMLTIHPRPSGFRFSRLVSVESCALSLKTPSAA